MSPICPASPADLGVMRSLLAATDCNVAGFAEAGYKALAGPQSIFPLALTALLTIYVALIGYRLMFGRGEVRLSDAPLIAVKIGAIVALALNWSTFQTVVLDLSVGAPQEIGHIVGDSRGDPLIRLQAAYDELLADQTAFVRLAGSNPLGLHSAEANAAEGLSQAATALLWSTAGILAFLAAAGGVLTAVGPVFIALFLFDVTRGVFVGWVRALLAVSLAPMLCWIMSLALLLTVEPWLKTLAAQRESATLSPDTATVASTLVLVFAAAQVVLLLAGAVIAFSFRLERRTGAGSRPEARDAPVSEMEARSRPQQLADAMQRLALSETQGLRSIAAGEAPSSRAMSAPRERHVSARAVRLGDTYRRGSFRDQHTRRGTR